MLPQVSKREFSKDSKKPASKTMCPIYQKCSKVAPSGSPIGVESGAPKWALGPCGPSWGQMGSNGTDYGAFLMSQRCTLDWFSANLRHSYWFTWVHFGLGFDRFWLSLMHYPFPISSINNPIYITGSSHLPLQWKTRGEDFQRGTTGGVKIDHIPHASWPSWGRRI